MQTATPTRHDDQFSVKDYVMFGAGCATWITAVASVCAVLVGSMLVIVIAVLNALSLTVTWLISNDALSNFAYD